MLERILGVKTLGVKYGNCGGQLIIGNMMVTHNEVYDVDVLATQSMENKTVTELFGDFYRLQNNDQEPSSAHLKVLDKVLRELEETP